MNYVGQLAETVFGTVKELYKGLNPATLTGCIDVIVVRQPDGTLYCSPFHVRFGKLRVLHSSEKVVDIEINGEPVDLHMKLGDNGEAFFVQEFEEQKESIPTSLCTSPIPSEKSSAPVTRSSSLHGNPDGSDTTLRKKRRCKKKPKKELAADSTSEEEETESERSLEEKRKLMTSNTSMYYSFTDVQNEGAGTLQPKEAYPYSDGELAPLQSLSPNSLLAPKSDSELEIRNPEMLLGSESHMQWLWGRLPEVSKWERAEATKPATSISMIPAVSPATTIPVGETTHFIAIKTGLEEDLDTADLDASCPPVTSLIRPTPVFSTGKSSLSGGEDPHPSTQLDSGDLESAQALAEEMKDVQGLATAAETEGKLCIEEVTEQIQELNQEVLASRRTSLGSTEPCSSLESQMEKRRGSVKRSSHLGPADIYLEDLSNLDSEQVALYFPKSDAELSGQAQADPGSFSHTHPLGGANVGNSTDNFLEPATCDLMPPILLSLCGGLGDDGELTHVEKFMKHIVSYQEFAENPAVLEDPNLVIQIQKKYYNWAVAAPMLLSLQAFQKNLPKSTVDRLMKEKMPKKGGRWWFSWRRRELSSEEQESRAQKTSTADKHQGDSFVQSKEDASSSDDESISSGQGDRPLPDAITQKFLPTYKKSLKLSSDQIKSLNLRDGPNEVVFSVTTQYQGTCRCEATIYLWNWDDKVVISDIDGTITRSDALGHILPYLGKDWTHQGIAKLFHKIHLNGYKFLYCSARAIGMAHITKGYLDCINDQGCVLPKGPILLAPSSLFSALHREVIEKKPEVFKIACLTDIRNLFGSNRQPFHAAFGNRTNDVYAYKEVELPESRIFTVNPKGELIQELIKLHKSTYDRLGEVVELLFPPVGKDVSVSLVCPEFSQFSYWRSPLPTVDLEDLA
ncbi:phosphatidate phosphatase LPIN3 isoform X2 [Hemicordylus capensis]|nr:phosphatidate phosphatase LPIN3 isoform X2 [Hemicordylus capensis]XP_053106989.1 phosphatidate phosphatase LPIN3 isoform X2 [Hemicordylus capensis]XP_053106990.1 phosphatidate phosphatase LPIN3 isoform X2 [Hemicordylus capensis]XP_053106991.1 phosphatidate phosphatase LPIN3 isoform X2 [Hemicordylus capensis]XP_053106992.1 phosphatidate phosphatase LPIN3 isoform X2 [Hemicordylus capensis]